MTIVSIKNKFIFIHIFKSGGSSLGRELSKYSTFRDMIQYSDNRLIHLPAGVLNKLQGMFHSNQGGGSWWSGYHKHEFAKNIVENMGFNSYSSFKSFAIIRSPSDWLSSLYFYVKNSNNHSLRKVAEKSSNHFFDYWISNQLPTQYDHVTNANKIIIDKLYKFDNFYDQKFAHILSEYLEIPKINIPHLNKSKEKMPQKTQLSHIISSKSSTYDDLFDYFKNDWVLYDSTAI